MKTFFLFFFVIFVPLSFADETAVPAPAAKIETAKPVEKAAAEDTAFAGEQLQIKKRMDTLFEASRKVNLTGAERSKARGEIESALDWDKVAQMCIGPTFYKKQSAANLNEFKRLLKDVITRTAYTRLDKFWADGTTYQVAKIDVKGNNAVLLSKFSVNGETFGLEYFLNKKGSNWQVWDISYENERYSVNINEQIDAFLKEKKFSDLLSKLRKRLEELSESKTKNG